MVVVWGVYFILFYLVQLKLMIKTMQWDDTTNYSSVECGELKIEIDKNTGKWLAHCRQLDIGTKQIPDECITLDEVKWEAVMIVLRKIEALSIAAREIEYMTAYEG